MIYVVRRGGKYLGKVDQWTESVDDMVLFPGRESARAEAERLKAQLVEIDARTCEDKVLEDYGVEVRLHLPDARMDG